MAMVNIRYDHGGWMVLPIYDACPDTWVWKSQTPAGCKGEWVDVGALRRMSLPIGTLTRDRFETELRRRVSKLPVNGKDGHLLCALWEVDNLNISFGLAYVPDSYQGSGWTSRSLKYSLPALCIQE